MGIELFSREKLSFVPRNLHNCCRCERKLSIKVQKKSKRLFCKFIAKLGISFLILRFWKTGSEKRGKALNIGNML